VSVASSQIQSKALVPEVELPFLATYRTMCRAPSPDFQQILEDVRGYALPRSPRGFGRKRARAVNSTGLQLRLAMVRAIDQQAAHA
jgi:hypothetical protein